MLAVTGNGTPALKNIETNRYPAEKTGGPCCETMEACSTPTSKEIFMKPWIKRTLFSLFGACIL